MDQVNGPKATSFQYGIKSQRRQAEKYRNREKNHWRHRIALAHDLVNRYALPRLPEKPRHETVVVDVGCSIGTFAIEFARLGYRSFGIDFDPSALEIARQLAEEQGVSPELVCGDVSDWTHGLPPADIAVCFDIFEHLHDDELGSLLTSLRRHLSKEGSLVFHTFPTQYDHIFFDKGYLGAPLLPLKYLPAGVFTRIVRAYSLVVDAALVFAGGMTHQEKISSSGHCNLTTRERLADLLKRAGYDIVFMGASNLYHFKPRREKWLSRQPVTHRNIYGVAVPSR